MKLTQSEMVLLLATTQGLEAVDAGEFYGYELSENNGLWIRNAEDALIYGLPIFDHNGKEPTYVMGVFAEVNEMLRSNGWFAEPYDAGTWMVYPE